MTHHPNKTAGAMEIIEGRPPLSPQNRALKINRPRSPHNTPTAASSRPPSLHRAPGGPLVVRQGLRGGWSLCCLWCCVVSWLCESRTEGTSESVGGLSETGATSGERKNARRWRKIQILAAADAIIRRC